MTEEERQRAIQAWLKSQQGSNLFSTTPMGQNQNYKRIKHYTAY